MNSIYSHLAGDAIQHGFLSTGGAMHDLNDLLVPGSGVTGILVGTGGGSINDLGQIAAHGVIAGQTHALLLTPTPEPGSLALLLGGSLLLGLRRRC